MSLFPEVDEEIDEIKAKEKEKTQKAFDNLKANSEMWLPSNGTEGMIFEDNFCAECSHDDVEKGILCEIIAHTMGVGEHEDLVLYADEVICLKDSNFDIKKYM